MDFKIEEVLIRLRSKLNEDQIKLWLPPYYLEGAGTSDEEIEKIALFYSEKLSINPDHCLAGVKELQNHALEKLNERNKFKETGVATLKIRVPGQSGGTVLSTVSISLNSRGIELKEAVAKQIANSPSRLKLICQGKVLTDDKSLEEQNVKNGIQMMAVVLYGDQGTSMKHAESQQKLVENTRDDVDILTNKNDNNYLQVEDQAGNTLNLPASEQKALIKAMAFHEKGKTALKQDDYSLALVMFLEADNEFSQCNSQILQSVDNYALLNLDIAWCYLCLRSVSQIPEAEERLQKCENNFHKSYGPNLERLIALKGSTGNEACLFMRLHLIQGVILFHKNRREEARAMLDRAERELLALKVCDTSLCTLIELGYSPAEARLGLRATHGDVNGAANYITRNREERAQKRRDAHEREKLKRERKKLGRCADGKQYVEPTLLKMLVNMGFQEHLAKTALAQANNIVSDSIQLIQEQPELLEIAMASTSRVKISKSMVEQVTAMGFNRHQAKVALAKHFGNVQLAIETLTAAGGALDNQSQNSKDSGNDDSGNEQKERDAYDRFTDGLTMVDDDHLDLTLIQEEGFLIQYKKLLE